MVGAARMTASLGQPLGANGESSVLGDVVRAENAALAEVDASLVDASLRPVIDRLPEPDRTVVRMRFGFEGGEPASYDAIAERLGRSVRVVRRCEQRALHVRGRRRGRGRLRRLIPTVPVEVASRTEPFGPSEPSEPSEGEPFHPPLRPWLVGTSPIHPPAAGPLPGSMPARPGRCGTVHRPVRPSARRGGGAGGAVWRSFAPSLFWTLLVHPWVS